MKKNINFILLIFGIFFMLGTNTTLAQPEYTEGNKNCWKTICPEDYELDEETCECNPIRNDLPIDPITPGGIIMPDNPLPSVPDLDIPPEGDNGSNDDGSNDNGSNDDGSNDDGSNDSGSNDSGGFNYGGGSNDDDDCYECYCNEIYCEEDPCDEDSQDYDECNCPDTYDPSICGDSNGNGTIIVVARDTQKWYRDGDGDGWGDNNDTKMRYEQPSGYVNKGGDCDDNDKEITTKVKLKDLVNSEATQVGDVIFSSGINSQNSGLGRDEQSSFGGGDSGVDPTSLTNDNLEIFRTLGGPLPKGVISARRRSGVPLNERAKSDFFDWSDNDLLSFLDYTLTHGSFGISSSTGSKNLILDSFMSKNGGIVQNDIIANEIDLNDGRDGHTINDFLDSIQEALCNLANKEVCPPLNPDDLESDISGIVQPNFNTKQNPTLFSQVGGTQGMEVLKGEDGSLQVAIYDTFGVDQADAVKDHGVIANEVIKGRRGLCAQWVLQHQRGYKPFVMKLQLDMASLKPINFNNCN